MASFSERVTIYIETKVDSATSQLKGLKQSVQDAEGATGKLKAAAGGLGDAVSSAAGAFLSPAGLAAGATAVAATAAKAVGQFEDLGLAIGKVRDGTGLSAEEASRWVEVADDAGISTESFTKSVGFLEKAIGTNGEAFKQWGVDVVKAGDGTTDVSATLLNAIGVLNGIQDPVKRNTAGLALFGKSWKDMSELIGRSSGQLKSDLAAVQDSKIFTDADISSARGVRDALDSVSDAVDGLMLTLGRSLAPAVAEIAPKLAEMITKAEPAIRRLGDAFADAAEAVGPLLDAVGTLDGLLDPIRDFSVSDDMGNTWSLMSGGLGQVQAAWGALNEEALKSDAVFDGTVKTTAQVAATAEQLAESQNRAGEAARNGTKAVADQTTNTAALAAQQKIAKQNAKTAADLIDAVNGKIQEHISSLKADAEALNAQSDAFGSAADDQIAYNEAQDEFNAKAKDSKASADDIRDAAIGAAKAHAELFTSMTESTGATVTATGKLDAQNQSLLETAHTAKGPARQAILDYIGSLNGIPPEKMTEINAAVAAGDLETAQRLLNEASANRTATIEADAKTTQAEKDLDALTKPRTVDVLIKGRRVGFEAAGGASPPGRLWIAGEAGPEFVKEPGRPTVLIDSPQFVPTGTRVMSVRRTRQILSRRPKRYARGTQMPAPLGDGSMTFIFQQQAPIYGVSDLDQHLARWSQRLAQQISAGKR